MSAGLIVSLRGRASSSPESSRNWPQQPSSSQDRARLLFRVVTLRSASSRVSTDGRRQSETVRARALRDGGGASSSPASENEPDALRSRSGVIGRSGNVGGRGQGRTNGKASGDRGVGDAEHQMGDGGRFVGGGGGGGVVARGDWRLALRGDATSAAELLGEGSGSALSVFTRNITVGRRPRSPGGPGRTRRLRAGPHAGPGPR